MNSNGLVKEWIDKWESGDYLNLPLAKEFTHTSPYGVIEGREAYLDLVRQNEDKFLPVRFEIHESLYGDGVAAVRCTVHQAEGFSLDASEWYYFKNGLILNVISYYHMGDIREDKRLDI